MSARVLPVTPSTTLKHSISFPSRPIPPAPVPFSPPPAASSLPRAPVRAILVLVFSLQLGGALFLILHAHSSASSAASQRNAERFDRAKSTVLSSIHDRFTQLNALLHQWRQVVPFVTSMEQFNDLFALDRDAFPLEVLWLPHVLHAQRAAFEAATHDDLSSFFNTSDVPRNISELVLDNSIPSGEATSPIKPSYFPIAYSAPALPPHYHMRDLASEPVRASIINATLAAAGDAVVGERVLTRSSRHDNQVHAVSTLTATAMSPANASHTSGVFVIFIRWQVFLAEHTTLPTAGSTHIRIFDLVQASDGCATPLLFSGTHNDDGSWTLAPSSELQQCSSANPKLSHSIVISGRSLRVELTKTSGFDESVDSTQVILGSAFLVVTIAMLLFIIATGWLIVQHMKRTATTTAKYVEELTVAEQEAREAKEHRDQFLAFLSHELRNPLFGLRGTLDEVAEHSVSPSSEPLPAYAHAAVDTLRNCSQQIERTLNTVVNVQNMANGKISLHSVPFRTSSLITSLKDHVAPVASEKRVSVHTYISPSVPLILEGDFERIVEAVGHLLRNAVQYAPQLTTVNLRVELQATYPIPHKYAHEHITATPVVSTARDQVALQFVVVDNGPGLTFRQIQRAFQPYTRERIARASQGRGSSLGLPIAQLLCKQMGGFMRVRSGPGQGSEFTAAVTLHTTALPPLPSPRTYDESDVTPSQSSAVDVSSLHGRFLVVDDQRINRRLVSRILSKLMPEATVDVAEDGLDAVTKVAAADAAGAPYSCIFMDIQMPRMSGTQATRQLRQNGFSKPIIAVTGGTLEEEIAKYFRAGMVGVIHKPCKKADFELLLQEHWLDVS